MNRLIEAGGKFATAPFANNVADWQSSKPVHQAISNQVRGPFKKRLSGQADEIERESERESTSVSQLVAVDERWRDAHWQSVIFMPIEMRSLAELLLLLLALPLPLLLLLNGLDAIVIALMCSNKRSKVLRTRCKRWCLCGLRAVRILSTAAIKASCKLSRIRVAAK